MIRRKLILLQISALFGGLLSALAWYQFCSGIVLMFSFVPFFLLAETEIPENSSSGDRLMFLRLLPGFAVFNIVSLAWIRITGVPLLVTTLTVNAFLMTFTFWLAWIVRKRAGAAVGNVSFIVFWLTMEYLSNNISFLSPWLNLGNGFAGNTKLIQWYEYTGTAGGTLWILVSNMAVASLIRKITNRDPLNSIIVRSISIGLVITLPVLISFSTEKRLKTTDGMPEEVVIVQPCIDPYLEKFSLGVDDQVRKVLKLAEGSVTPMTKWIIAPETTIPLPVNIDSADMDINIALFIEFLQNHQSSNFILGAVTTSNRPYKQIHNSTLLLSHSGTVAITHKSKLVPGIESSFPKIISFMRYLFPDLGGVSGGYTGQQNQEILKSPDSGTSAAPIICFESVFGGYVSGFAREGAGFLAIITNDGWLKGTLGFYQHLNFSALRAIETRKPVVRASNTGISAVIDPAGNITHSIPWWESGTINTTIIPQYRITIYARYGDLILRTATAISLFILIIHLVAIPVRRKYGIKKT